MEEMCKEGKDELNMEANSAASKFAGPADSGVGRSDTLTANTKASV